uniref:Uncharacterized protein n=1 Tax=Romanomermis culicivorax TaxID=13658 RepID=A0A915L8P7_ROMCU
MFTDNAESAVLWCKQDAAIYKTLMAEVFGYLFEPNASDMQIQTQNEIGKDDQQTLVTRRPTYAQWIAAAIDSTTKKAMTLADINEWMIKNVPGLAEQRYLHSCKGWKKQ